MQYISETITDQRFTQAIEGSLDYLLIEEDDGKGIRCVLWFANSTETGGIDYFNIMIHIDYQNDGIYRLIAEVPFKADAYSLGETPDRMAELVVKETAEWLAKYPSEVSA